MAYYYVVRVFDYQDQAVIDRVPVHWDDYYEETLTNANGVTYIAASNGDPDTTYATIGGESEATGIVTIT